MRNIVLTILLIIFIGVWARLGYYFYKEDQANQKPYTVTIIHGSSAIGYSATL